MEQIATTQAPDNRSYQEQLARTLMDCLGLDGAIHACQANSWDGVLAFLLPPIQPETR